MPLPAGTVIDSKYEVISVLGQGAFAAVYLANQLDLGREVAVKLLGAPVDVETCARFQREAQILVSLNHPNLVGCYGHGIWRGCPFIVLQYVDGTSLQTILALGKPLNWERSIRIIKQLSLALTYVHAHGIMHRDIKAANIILSAAESPDETVKLIDFGLAKLLPHWSKAAQSLTAEGQLLGTETYMSPEQCRGERVTIAADVYSVGCLLFHCLSGNPPFNGEHSVIVMHKHLTEPVPQIPESIPEAVRQGLSAIIGKATEKEPEDRYRTLSELIDDLSAVEILQGAVTTHDTVVPPFRSVKKFRFLATVSLLMLSLVGAVLVATNHRAVADAPRGSNFAAIDKSAIKAALAKLEEVARSRTREDYRRLVADAMDRSPQITLTTWEVFADHAGRLIFLKEYEKSLLVLDLIKERYPPCAFDPRYCLARYNSLFLLGRNAEAAEQLTRAGNLSTTPRAICCTSAQLGMFEFSQERWSESLSYMEKARKADQECFDDHFSVKALPSMVFAADRLGKFEDAERYLQEIETKIDKLASSGARDADSWCAGASLRCRLAGWENHAKRLATIALYIGSHRSKDEQASVMGDPNGKAAVYLNSSP